MSIGTNVTPISAINSGNGTNGLLSLNNFNKYGIISSNCCHVANFENTGNIVDALLFNQFGGSVAMAGNTDVGWYPNGQQALKKLSQSINHCHFGIETLKTRYFPANYSYSNSTYPYHYSNYETYLSHNYFGDPEMMNYTKEPIKIAASVSPRHIALDVANTIEVTINNLDYQQIATVCLYQPSNGGNEFQDVQQAVGTQNLNEVIAFNIPPNTLLAGDLFVTITGFNFLPFIDTIVVSPNCVKKQTIEEITGIPFPWVGRKYKDQDVIIKSGATLTVKGEVYFVPGSKLIVEPGAKLVIDGGVLGTSCEALWEGVEVWGRYDQIQLSNYQGVVEIINGGTIKDAVFGIRAYKSTLKGYDDSYTGGILRCTNSNFINNQTAIIFHPYKYNTTPNLSFFTNSNFIWDDNYILPDNPFIGGYPVNMVDLNGINNIYFTRCKFENRMTTSQFDEKRGNAFYTYNSNFTVKGDDNTFDLSKIEGFHYGIRCGSVVPGLVNIKNTTFDNNLRGVYCGTNNILMLVNRNKFYTHTGTELKPACGIYLDNATGYSVQENYFEGNYEGIVDTHETGIIVNNSGPASNEIYNNTFITLQNGITAQDMNRSLDGMTGLVCKCNDYTYNMTDESVLLSEQAPPSSGIARYQGDDLSDSGPAGNTFSVRESGTGDLDNDGIKIEYYHHREDPNSSFRVKPQYNNNVTLRPTNREYTKPLACPSKLGGAILDNEIKSELTAIGENTAQKESVLVSLIDGGNTEETTKSILYSLPSEALELRDELLEKSPYLSDTVMQAAISNENVFPNVMIRDILISNPHSSTSESVLYELDNRNDPMPDEMYNQILDCETIISPKETREMELASIKSNRAQLYNQLISYYISDTTGLLSDSLYFFLIGEPTIEAKYLLASLQLQEGDTLSVDNTLDLISQSFNLTGSEQALHNDYIAWFNILTEIKSDTVLGFIPDSSQIINLMNIMSIAHEPVKFIIRNILVNSGVVTYEEPFLLNYGLRKDKFRRKLNTDNKPITQKANINPNPCSDYAIISFNLHFESSINTRLEIINIQGVTVKTFNLPETLNQFVLPLSDLNSGVYIVSLKSDNKIIENHKIIVI